MPLFDKQLRKISTTHGAFKNIIAQKKEKKKKKVTNDLYNFRFNLNQIFQYILFFANKHKKKGPSPKNLYQSLLNGIKFNQI
jgi:hypothetical protein